MKHMTFVQWAVWLGFIYSVCSCQPRPDLKLWYTRPAERWEETLPLGNGRLGMMPDGGVVQETIVLNDITMWSGSFQDTRNPEASGTIPVHTVQQPASSLINMPHLHPHRHILRNH